jgi:hypothetical protein
VNTANSVNKAAFSNRELERALADELHVLLSDIPWLKALEGPSVPPGDGDAIVQVGTGPGGKAVLHVHFKTEMRPGAFSTWAERHETPRSAAPSVRVLGVPFVSARLAELCRRAGWSWFDLAGNCWLDVPGLLRIERTGHPPVHRASPPAANLGTPAAARVLRVILSPAHAGHTWTQRAVQEQTCWRDIDEAQPVSLGLVNKVVRRLRDEGFVEEAEKPGFRVRDPIGLLAAWREAYRFDSHERRGYFTLLKGERLRQALHRADLESGGFIVYAAFSAAERQAPHVRQPRIWLYVAPRFLEAFVRHTEAKEVESGENLVVLLPDDPGVFLSFDADSSVGDQQLGCTDPVQTYLDLLHCGGRGEEAANAVFEQRLLPSWKAVGLAR